MSRPAPVWSASVFSEILGMVATYRKATVRPRFVVMDVQTYRRLTAEMGSARDVVHGGPLFDLDARGMILGVVPVVIPTDGLPMLRVVATPADEVRLATTETTE